MSNYWMFWKPSAWASLVRPCQHDWRYDHEESKGPWTGYIERCSRCGALKQVAQ